MDLSKRRWSRTNIFLSLILFWQCLTVGSAIASTQKLELNKNKQQKITQMTTTSEDILVGQVKSLSARWVGNVIVTTAEIQPLETFKGKSSQGLINVSYVGGRIGVIEQVLSLPLQLEEGETAVLFLKDAPSKTALAGSKMFTYVDGKIPLLKKGDDLSSLKSNSNISSFLDTLRKNNIQ